MVPPRTPQLPLRKACAPTTRLLPPSSIPRAPLRCARTSRIRAKRPVSIPFPPFVRNDHVLDARRVGDANAVAAHPSDDAVPNARELGLRLDTDAGTRRCANDRIGGRGTADDTADREAREIDPNIVGLDHDARGVRVGQDEIARQDEASG